MKKNMIMTVAATMVMALICVGFGFHLGTKQVSYSLSKYSDSSEYDNFQKSLNYPTRDEAIAEPKEPFVTAGELIKQSDNFGWLLSPATSLASNNIPVKADLSTNVEWETASCYSTTLKLPDEVFIDDSNCNASVYYPTELKAGETGTIVVIVASDNGYTYCSFCQFTAADDLKIVYGSSDPQVASGGEFISHDDSLIVNFYTAATPKHYSNRDGLVGKFGAYGDMWVKFIDINSPANSLDLQSDTADNDAE